MNHFDCPSCGVTVSVSVSTRRKRPDSVRPGEEISALREFARRHPGEHQTSELHALYLSECSEFGGPEIGQRNFGLALQAIGAKRSRTKDRRTWVL